MKILHTKVPNKLSVWSEFNQLCARYQSMNFSHGRPSTYPPEYLLEEMKKLSEIPEIHQYTSLWGHPELQKSISDYYSPLFNRQLKINAEILVTPGAMSGHFNGIFGIATEPTDEVFTFAPYFPTYLNQTQFSGIKFQTSKFIYNQKAEKWEINYDDLIKKINKNTRIIMLNSPQNPTGKIFSEEELIKLSHIFDQHAPNAVIINDVVYEDLIFDNNDYKRFANILDNWKRTITVYSGGKLMSCTGWKIGWLIGPNELIKACAIINESIAFQTNTICQIAIARSLPKFRDTPSYGFKNYTTYVRSQFQACRDMLTEGLKKSKLGIVPFHVEAGYFLMADVKNVKPYIDEIFYTKNEFCSDLEGVDYKRFEDNDKVSYDYVISRFMTLKIKISPMPITLFYTEDNFEDQYIRLAICQNTDTMQEAIKKLEETDKHL